LPLVSGTAWDRQTAQLAVVAEAHQPYDVEAWKQLLFAASGLRHHLSQEDRSAFGTPLVLAVVDDHGERMLRGLAEELATSYAVFSRVDLNLVRLRDLDDSTALDIALAPLLPCCRRHLGETISHADVVQFWDLLRANIVRAGNELPGILGEHRAQAGKDLAEQLAGGMPRNASPTAPVPVTEISATNFRSFGKLLVELAPVTILHGANGSGKSSVLEALELVWSGTSQRRPADVERFEYQRHLPYDGTGAFSVRGRLANRPEPVALDQVREHPAADLPRNVLTQETLGAFVAAPPAERYTSLVAMTGLEIPDVESRTKTILDACKRDLDRSLAAAGIPALAASNRDALRHLQRSLQIDVLGRVPHSAEHHAIENALAKATSGTYQPRGWPDDDRILDAVREAEVIINRLSDDLEPSARVETAIDDAVTVLAHEAVPRREAAGAANALLNALREASRPTPAPNKPQPASMLSPSLATSWLLHADSLTIAAERFKGSTSELSDPKWKQQLQRYIDALTTAAEVAPRDELRAISQSLPADSTVATASVPESLYTAAGFERPPDNPNRVVPLLTRLVQEWQQQASTLESLSSELACHPARTFDRHAERVVEATCRFELARQIRRKGPITAASLSLVSELLKSRLYPVVRELVAATVRFEWYFEPLQLTLEGSEVVIGGLATSRADLDGRLLLNTAERTVVGLAWFLALHMLQPQEQRRVLVLDDPVSAFDSVNRAGFAATIRAFVRLIRPEQVVVATHDDAIAALLAEELSPVEGWPASVFRIRCHRDEDDLSTATVVWTNQHSSDLDADTTSLGLDGESTLFTQ
jgi:energy-coupling factor transporter ATP-binding protein EcfA2